jgi:hypothetical protein
LITLSEKDEEEGVPTGIKILDVVNESEKGEFSKDKVSKARSVWLSGESHDALIQFLAVDKDKFEEANRKYFNHMVDSVKLPGYPKDDSGTQDETITWKTYKIDDIGFSMDYPEGWTVEPTDGGILAVIKQSFEECGIKEEVPPNLETIDEYIEWVDGLISKEGEAAKLENLTQAKETFEEMKELGIKEVQSVLMVTFQSSLSEISEFSICGLTIGKHDKPDKVGEKEVKTVETGETGETGETVGSAKLIVIYGKEHVVVLGLFTMGDLEEANRKYFNHMVDSVKLPGYSKDEGFPMWVWILIGVVIVVVVVAIVLLVSKKGKLDKR